MEEIMYSHSYPLHLQQRKTDGYFPTLSFTGTTTPKTTHSGNSMVFSFSPFFSPSGFGWGLAKKVPR